MMSILETAAASSDAMVDVTSGRRAPPLLLACSLGFSGGSARLYNAAGKQRVEFGPGVSGACFVTFVVLQITGEEFNREIACTEDPGPPLAA